MSTSHLVGGDFVGAPLLTVRVSESFDPHSPVVLGEFARTTGRKTSRRPQRSKGVHLGRLKDPEDLLSGEGWGGWGGA